jgi:hypothetical protein
MRIYRTKTRVEGHRVTVELPIDFPDGDVEVIVLPAASDADDLSTQSRPQRVSVDDLLAHRLTRPPGVEPVSLADMQRAIVGGALGRCCDEA